MYDSFRWKTGCNREITELICLKVSNKKFHSQNTHWKNIKPHFLFRSRIGPSIRRTDSAWHREKLRVRMTHSYLLFCFDIKVSSVFNVMMQVFELHTELVNVVNKTKVGAATRIFLTTFISSCKHSKDKKLSHLDNLE